MSKLVVGLAVAAISLIAAPATASEHEVPATPSEFELAESIRRLEPVVRSLKPVVRSLSTERRKGDQRIVTISSDVLFEFDSAELTSNAERVVDELAQRIAETKGPVSVVGHTDSIGADAYNQDLSERRASAVADALRAVIGSDRPLTVAGRGETQPVAPNEKNGDDNPAGRALNRRVVVTFPRS